MNKKQRERLKQQAPIVLDITGVGHDGRGIGHHEGKIVFVDGALEGETVEAKVTLEKSKYNEADTVAVLKPSAIRVIPPCEHFGVCGGCSLQHIEPSAQIALKQRISARTVA